MLSASETTCQLFVKLPTPSFIANSKQGPSLSFPEMLRDRQDDNCIFWYKVLFCPPLEGVGGGFSRFVISTQGEISSN